MPEAGRPFAIVALVPAAATMHAPSMYQTLDPEKIIGTLEKLERRIAQRFPGSGLLQVSAQLTGMARLTSARVAEIARPHRPLKFLLGLVIVLTLGLVALLVTYAVQMQMEEELSTIMQGLDAGVSLMIVLGGAAFFLFTLEARLRRSEALKGLHEFRSIVHIIDMHQLTKDPSAFGAPRTSGSPERRMSSFELVRYLNYCSELLSLASKVAALYAEKIRDPVVIDAVGDIERLTTNLSQKIWQKITMVEERIPGRPPSDELAPKAVA